MKFPNDYRYTKDHEWIKDDGNDQWTIGITHYALEQLGDIVHLELPNVGDSYETGDSFGTIESTKTVSDLYLPLAGSVSHVNEKIIDDVEKLSQNPYTDGWLIKVNSRSHPDEGLLSAEEYSRYLEED